MNFGVFDIETDALPESELPPFDESSVKLGRIKDPEKIQLKIDEAKAKWSEQFALHAETGRVLVIGVHSLKSNGFNFIHEEDESKLLVGWWNFCLRCLDGQSCLAGVNIKKFDLPFMARRSWILGVYVPQSLLSFTAYGPRWAPLFLDLSDVWELGDRQQKSSFDHIGKTLGTGGKTKGDHGASFAELWRNDRETAIDYLRNDCIQPAKWIERFFSAEESDDD